MNYIRTPNSQGLLHFTEDSAPAMYNGAEPSFSQISNGMKFDCDISSAMGRTRNDEIMTFANSDIDDQDWEKLRQIIHRLYVKEKMKFEDLQSLMILAYQFKAT
jgi:hypothetical protein